MIRRRGTRLTHCSLISGTMNSTNSAIKRFIEYYGSIDKESLCEFFGIGESEYYTLTKDARDKIKKRRKRNEK